MYYQRNYRMINHMVFAGFVLVMLNSCAMREVHMHATRPALVNVPSAIQTILILDRSNPENKNKDVIGAVLSAELPGERKAAAQEALNGLQQQMMSTSRFNVIRATEIYNGSNISTAFPDPLPWNDIKRLCDQYHADAVVALEIFSPKFVVTNGTRIVKKRLEATNTEIPVPEFYAEGVATVSVGYRFYDLANQNIPDQKVFSTSNHWGTSGMSVADAMSLLINKGEALKKVSYDAGMSYGARITPITITITRPFYNRPKGNSFITKGARQADTNQWYDALETWKSGVDNAKQKIAGKLAYNVAIAFEVIGDYESAIDWASKSYVDFRNKKGREYAQNLRYREREEQYAQEQMK